jgi:hypothetical protein
MYFLNIIARYVRGVVAAAGGGGGGGGGGGCGCGRER